MMVLGLTAMVVGLVVIVIAATAWIKGMNRLR